MGLRTQALRLGPLENNSYVVSDEATGETAIVDVGFGAREVIAFVRDAGLSVRWLLGTHAHYDHAAGMLEVQQALGGVYALHPLDRPLLDVLATQGSMFGFPPAEPPAIGLELADGTRVPLGTESFEVLHTPGHSPGHVTFKHGRDLWVGDVLFRESVGRTDLPGGDPVALERSIRERLFPLGDDCRCLTGHGPETTIGHERRWNPFVGEIARRG